MLWLQHALAFLILVVAPAWGYFALRKLKASPSTRLKIRRYRQIIAVDWIVFALILAAAGRNIFWAPHPFHWMRFIWAEVIGLVVAAGIAFILLSPFFGLGRPKTRTAIRRAFEPLSFFIPTRQGEFVWFGAACVTGGICEEWLFRGFFFRYFGETPWHLGIPAAFAIATIAFGAGHLYQGWKGIFTTGFTGAVMGLLYLWTGSLLVPMIVHVLIDLRGLFLAKAAYSKGSDLA